MGLNVGYVRVSTMKESQKDSPEHQEALIREYALREGIKLDIIYEDRDSATSIVDREDVQRMINSAKRGEISSVWFASLSRFSRDTLDALSLKRIFVNALKVRLVSIEDGYDSAKKDDELLFGVKSVVNQNQSEQISISSKRGIRQSAMKGNFTGSIAPYGYKKVVIDGRKTLEVVPEQAEVVKLIYDLYVNHGMGDKNIVHYLNEHNIPSYRGRTWGISSIQRILTNENYTGFTVFGKYTTETAYDDLRDLMRRKKKLVQKPKNEWERTTFQTHEAIISQELFQRAQEMRFLRSGGKHGGNRGGGRKAYVNVFAKLIFCAECNSAYVTMKGKMRGKDYRYLMCSRNRRMGKSGCLNNKWLPYQSVRDDLINEILMRLKEKISDFEDGINEIDLNFPTNDFDREKKKLQKRIEDNRRLLFEIRRQHMLGEIDNNQYNFEKELYEKEITEAERRLLQISIEEKRVIDTEKVIQEIKKALKELTELKSYDDFDKTRSLLLQVVKRIEVSKDGEITIQTRI